MSNVIQVGAKVGSGRFPAMGGGERGKPWAGVVLDRCDPRAWAGTLAFGDRKATREEIAAHIAKVGGIPSSVPVLWSFGQSGTKVYWERAESLRPYAEELAEWQEERRALRKSAALELATA